MALERWSIGRGREILPDPGVSEAQAWARIQAERTNSNRSNEFATRQQQEQQRQWNILNQRAQQTHAYGLEQQRLSDPMRLDQQRMNMENQRATDPLNQRKLEIGNQALERELEVALASGDPAAIASLIRRREEAAIAESMGRAHASEAQAKRGGFKFDPYKEFGAFGDTARTGPMKAWSEGGPVHHEAVVSQFGNMLDVLSSPKAIGNAARQTLAMRTPDQIFEGLKEAKLAAMEAARGPSDAAPTLNNGQVNALRDQADKAYDALRDGVWEEAARRAGELAPDQEIDFDSWIRNRAPGGETYFGHRMGGEAGPTGDRPSPGELQRAQGGVPQATGPATGPATGEGSPLQPGADRSRATPGNLLSLGGRSFAQALDPNYRDKEVGPTTYSEEFFRPPPPGPMTREGGASIGPRQPGMGWPPKWQPPVPMPYQTAEGRSQRDFGEWRTEMRKRGAPEEGLNYDQWNALGKPSFGANPDPREREPAYERWRDAESRQGIPDDRLNYDIWNMLGKPDPENSGVKDAPKYKPGKSDGTGRSAWENALLGSYDLSEGRFMTRDEMDKRNKEGNLPGAGSVLREPLSPEALREGLSERGKRMPKARELAIEGMDLAPEDMPAYRGNLVRIREAYNSWSKRMKRAGKRDTVDEWLRQGQPGLEEADKTSRNEE